MGGSPLLLVHVYIQMHTLTSRRRLKTPRVLSQGEWDDLAPRLIRDLAVPAGPQIRAGTFFSLQLS